MSDVETARRGFEAALRGDSDAIAEILDPDVQWHGGDPSAPGACHSRPEALSFMRQSDIIRGGRFELVDMAGEAEPGPVANLTTFRDGKVVEIVHYPDANDALAAAGADFRQLASSQPLLNSLASRPARRRSRTAARGQKSKR